MSARIGRILAVKLGESLGQSVIVDNRGGAGGNIGAELAAKTPADGYPLLMGALTAHSIMANLEKGQLRYSITKDFIPICEARPCRTHATTLPTAPSTQACARA